jgi:hypothetical protein
VKYLFLATRLLASIISNSLNPLYSGIILGLRFEDYEISYVKRPSSESVSFVADLI